MSGPWRFPVGRGDLHWSAFSFGLGVTLLAFLAVRAGGTSPTTPLQAGDTARLGYTWSLAFWVVPAVILGFWCRRTRTVSRLERKALRATLWIQAPIWCLFDVVFGHTFFTFPNAKAHVGWTFWSYDFATGWRRGLPVEEFVFYSTGIAAVLLAYLWLSRLFFAADAPTDASYREQARVAAARPALSVGLVAIAGAVFAAALAYKRLASHPDGGGFPGYFLVETLMILLPSALFFRLTHRLLNLRAFGFTLLAVVIVSLVWEVTLALPNGWWGFREEQMIGIYIAPWAGLPLEEPILWCGAVFMLVGFFEFTKLYLVSRRPLRELLLGKAPG